MNRLFAFKDSGPSITQPRKRKELITIFALLAGLLLLIIMRLFKDSFYFVYDHSHFLTIHTSLELLSIAISLSVSIHGFLVFPHNLSRHRLYISSLFLAIGLLDLFHTLSYFGMPRFITENTMQKPTWFWVVARFIQFAVFLVIFSIRDNAENIKKRRFYLVLPILFVVLVSAIIVLFESSLPILIEPGVGVTPLKRGIEYFSSVLGIGIVITLLRRYKRDKDVNLLYMITAFTYLLMSQIIFTIYKDVFDSDNFLGHFYKIVGFYYLLKGIYLSMIEEPYEKKLAAEESLRSYQHQLTSKILLAQEEERKRLSRELHDRVGQALYSVSVGLQVFEMEQQKNDPSIVEKLENVRNMLTSSMDEVKNISVQLRPSALDQLGLVPALKSHIENYQSIYKITIILNLDSSYSRQDIQIETNLYRVIVEALNNSAKHANTKKITIDLGLDRSIIYLKIQDYGDGFILDHILAQQKGIGLYSMNERIQQIDGEIKITSEIDKGTTVEVWIDLEKN